MIAVSLTTEEASKCYQQALDIDNECLQNNRDKPRVLQSIEAHFIGSLGEFALAKYLQVDFDFGCDYKRQPHDVTMYEVRTTKYANGKLITYNHDKSAPYVLATLNMDNGYTITLRGWALLDECNIDEHWNTSAKLPSYWTPQHKLHNMTDLPMAAV